jgi:DNA-binding CsgD family transcriptional regulator/PAS domain-containing protein
MAKPLSPEKLSALIGSIYDCALDPSGWERTLTEITSALCCQTAVLHLNDIQHNRLLMHKSVGLEPYWLHQVEKHVAEMHALLPSRPEVDEPYVLSREVDQATIKASPFVRTWLRPQGLVDIAQLFLIHTPARLSGLGLGRHRRHGLITERELGLARLLIPHVRRAVTISNVLDVRTIERARMTEALDALRCGVVLTNGRGVILYANQAAQHMLRSGGVIEGQGGMLIAKTPSAAAELRVALKAAMDETRIGKTGLAIRLTEPEMPVMFAHVLPLSGGDLRTRLEPEAVAAVFVSAPPDGKDAADVTAATYDLTPAETRVLAYLLGGHTLAEAATRLAITPSTAKAHLDNIFAKTRVSRQADLMRLGLGLAAPTRLGK